MRITCTFSGKWINYFSISEQEVDFKRYHKTRENVFKSLTLKSNHIILMLRFNQQLHSWNIGNSFEFGLKSKQNMENKILNFRNLMRVNIFPYGMKGSNVKKSRLRENHSNIIISSNSKRFCCGATSQCCAILVHTQIGPVCSYIKAIQFNCKFHQVLTLHFHFSLTATHTHTPSQNTKYCLWMVSHTF